MTVNIKPPVIPQVKTPSKYEEHLDTPAPASNKVFIDHLKSPSSDGTVKVDHVKNNYGQKTITPVEETHEKMLNPPIPLDKLHNLAVAGKMTINLGNYESAQIMVSLTVPCTKETLEDAYNFASDWVSDKIENAVNKAKKGIS